MPVFEIIKWTLFCFKQPSLSLFTLFMETNSIFPVRMFCLTVLSLHGTSYARVFKSFLCFLLTKRHPYISNIFSLGTQTARRKVLVIINIKRRTSPCVLELNRKAKITNSQNKAKLDILTTVTPEMSWVALLIPCRSATIVICMYGQNYFHFVFSNHTLEKISQCAGVCENIICRT